MNQPPTINIERVSKLKESLSSEQLYTIADALMRAYFGPVFSGDKQKREKIKEVLKLVVAACPRAQYYLNQVESQ